MTVKRLLLFSPLLLCGLLVQSYFWIPSFEEQTRGNPGRLTEYRTASIGDATLLNPVLSADVSSSQIESLVFEGLLDRDKNLRFRGRLAAAWEVTEKAAFYVNEGASQVPSARVVAQRIREAVRSRASFKPLLRDTLEAIEQVSVLPPRTETLVRPLPGPSRPPREIRIRIHAPARIQLSLTRVVPELFIRLEELLGAKLFHAFEPERHVRFEPPLDGNRARKMAHELLPPLEHNPILLFHLRPGVTFHDGHPLDAWDVKFTYEALMDPANLSPRSADFEPVKAVEVLDASRVRVVYKRLHSPAVASWGIGILPEHLLNARALAAEARQQGLDPENFSLRDSRFNRRPVGCGPFVFGEWRSDQFIRLERFENYWEGPPHYRRYVFRIIPDRLTQEMEFYAGSLDSYGDTPWVSPLGVPPHQVVRLKRHPDFQAFSGTASGYTYIGYNLRRKPFDDPRVRRALGMAVDVDAIITHVLHGQGERVSGPFLKQTDYYDRGVKPLPYDPESALRLLKEAGWHRNASGWLEREGRPLRFTLITNSGNDLRKAVLAVAQNAWRRIGIDVRTDVLEWSVFIQERVDKADFDAVILGWYQPVEPDLFQIWHSSQTGRHQLNFIGFKNPEADRLIVRIRQEYDHAKQVADCHRLHRLIAREQPYTFLYARRWTAILDRRIVMAYPDRAGTLRYRPIEPGPAGLFALEFTRWMKLPHPPAHAP